MSRALAVVYPSLVGRAQEILAGLDEVAERVRTVAVREATVWEAARMYADLRGSVLWEELVRDLAGSPTVLAVYVGDGRLYGSLGEAASVVSTVYQSPERHIILPRPAVRVSSGPEAFRREARAWRRRLE